MVRLTTSALASYGRGMTWPTRVIALSTALFAVLFLLFVLLMSRSWGG